MRSRFAMLLAGIAAVAATPAFASGQILCEGDNVSVDMLVGRLPVLSILRVVVRVGDQTWTTDQDFASGTPIAVGQRFEDDRQLLVDFTDDNVEDVIGRVRAFTLQEGNDSITGGVFSLKDEGVFLVDCSLRG